LKDTAFGKMKFSHVEPFRRLEGFYYSLNGKKIHFKNYYTPAGNLRNEVFIKEKGQLRELFSFIEGHEEGSAHEVHSPLLINHF
jgi:hypothetical protein